MKEYKENVVKKTTFVNYTNRVEKHIEPAIGRYQLKSLRAEQVQKMINGMIENGLSVETVSGTYNLISEALKQSEICVCQPKS